MRSGTHWSFSRRRRGGLLGSNKRRSGCLTPDENTIFNHLELFRMLAKVRDRTRSPTLPFQPPKKNFAQLFDSTREREREREIFHLRIKETSPKTDPSLRPNRSPGGLSGGRGSSASVALSSKFASPRLRGRRGARRRGGRTRLGRWIE